MTTRVPEETEKLHEKSQVGNYYSLYRVIADVFYLGVWRASTIAFQQARLKKRAINGSNKCVFSFRGTSAGRNSPKNVELQRDDGFLVDYNTTGQIFLPPELTVAHTRAIRIYRIGLSEI